MKRSTFLPFAVAASMLAMLGALNPAPAASFTWTGGIAGDNGALWGASCAANWKDNLVPLDNPGGTVNILENWPTTTGYGTRTIQIRQHTTFGVLNVETPEEGAATIVAQNYTT